MAPSEADKQKLSCVLVRQKQSITQLCMRYVVPVILRTKGAAFRRYTVAEFEKAADDFAKKRFGCGGTLPDRLVEVRCCFMN